MGNEMELYKGDEEAVATASYGNLIEADHRLTRRKIKNVTTTIYLKESE